MANRAFDGIRERLGHALRGRSFPLYFSLSLAYHAANDGWHRRKFRRRNECQPLSALSIRPHRSSDTLFILGSGASVNEYADSQWDEIDRHDSLGFNFWLIHDFVPTYYVGELPMADGPVSVETYYDLITQRADEYTGVPFIVKDIHGTSFALDTDRLPPQIREQLYVPITLPVPADRSTPELFCRSLRWLDRIGVFDGRDSVRTLFHKRSSIVDVTLLGLMYGYENVVLCGVDFNDNTYFYQDRRDYYEAKGRPVPFSADTEITGDDHGSMDQDVGELTAPQFLTMIRDEIARPNGIELWIGAKSSRLYPELPYYFDRDGS